MKNISRNPLTKFIAFILTIIFITIIALQLAYTQYSNFSLESIVEKEFKNSRTFEKEVNKAIKDVYGLLESVENNKIENVSYLYFIKDSRSNSTFDNTNYYNMSFFQENKEAFFSYVNGEYMVGETTSSSLELSFPRNKDYILYLAFPDDFMLERQIEWDYGRESLIPLIYSMTIFFVGAIFLISYLVFVAGRKIGTEKLYVSSIDRIYTEFLILGFVPLLTLFLTLHKVLFYTPKSNYSLNNTHIFNILIGFATLMVSCLFLISLLSLTRKIKNKDFVKGSLISIILKSISPYLKELWYKSGLKDDSLTKSLYKRQILFTISSAILILLILIFAPRIPQMLVFIIPQMILVYWYIKSNNNTFKKIDEGFKESLEEQMKAERMKIELITNVSHDLKTPLTSIISYIDLLSKEDISESARNYIGILSEKSNRLKKIVADVFDLAKSTSGDIQLNFQTLDLKKLIEQTLGDMVDDIEKSRFQIKTVFPEKPVYIVSDGKRLYRVFQNIIDNALKYSMEETRIYVELIDEGDNASVVIKNIASYEMNFTPEEILQRFNRGDGSRTNEGSGLGLSIAESFSNACGGDFKIDIDGDMFKVIISFRTVESMDETVAIGN